MHNSRLSNPLDPFAKSAKQIHGKTKKTDDDYVELAKREWIGGVYHDDTLPRDLRDGIGPYLPGENIERMLTDSAKLSRDGAKVKRGVMIEDMFCQLQYPGPRDLATLSEDDNFRLIASVKVGMKRVMRCRPLFRNWSVSARGYLDPEVMNPDELAAAAERAGRLIGLGDWRPRYGRFTATMTFSDDV